MSALIGKTESSLLGVWALTSVELYPTAKLAGTPIQYPFGEAILGRVVFTPDGYMAGTVSLNYQNKTSFSSKDWSLLKDDEIVEIVRTMSTYSGPWSLHEDGGEIWMKIDVEIALNPSWIGSPQFRRKVEIQEKDGQGGEKDLILTLAPVEGITLPVRPKTLPSYIYFHTLHTFAWLSSFCY